MEVVALVLAGESLALAHAGHIDALAFGEHLHRESRPDCGVAGIPQLLQTCAGVADRRA